MVTIRYYAQTKRDPNRAKILANPRYLYCQVQPPDNIGNLSASRRCLWDRTAVSTAASIFQNLDDKLQRKLSDIVLLIHQTKSSKATHNVLVAIVIVIAIIEELHEGKSCDNLH